MQVTAGIFGVVPANMNAHGIQYLLYYTLNLSGILSPGEAQVWNQSQNARYWLQQMAYWKDSAGP
jgi:hypothetical protein